jgi:hypothetical protein
MITVFSSVSVVLGAAIAYWAGAYPRHQAVMETVAGFLLLAGFGLLGYELECALGHPWLVR